jgi:hypothetical protein
VSAVEAEENAVSGIGELKSELATLHHPRRVGVLAGLIVVAIGVLLFGVAMAIRNLFGTFAYLIVVTGLGLSLVGLYLLRPQWRGRSPPVQ